MTKKQSILVLVFTATILVIAGVIVFRDYFNEEGNVYLAFLKDIKNQAHDVAFLSKPSTCEGAKNIYLPEASSELFSDFLSANSDSAKPINLRSLEGFFNVVSIEEASQLHANKFLYLFRSSSKRLIALSRVGFDRDNTHALFCIETDIRGDLVLLSKENNAWKVKKVSNVWIS